MSERDLRTAVRDLQDEIARLESRCDALESLVRDLWEGYGCYMPPDCCDGVRERMRGLGVEVDA